MLKNYIKINKVLTKKLQNFILFLKNRYNMSLCHDVLNLKIERKKTCPK